MTEAPPPTLTEILAGIDGKPASYLAAARQLAQHAGDGLTPVRIFVLASFTFDLVTPYLVVEAARRGLAAQVATGPFGQLEQQVLEPGSQLYGFDASVIVIAARVEDLAPELVDGFLAAPPTAAAAYVARIAQLCTSIRAHSAARIVVWNQPPPRRLVAGLADPALAPGQSFALAELDRQLAAACTAVPGVVMFDAARLATELGTRQWYDAKLQALARMPLSGAAQIAVGKQLARVIRALTHTPCKCLVLDLDNTLWGGVLGEDGLAGIALGEDHPGSAYKAFQRVVRGYRDRGVLLAIASKNNPGEVDELFASHRDMVLARDQFAAVQVHWNDKASSLRAIAAELQIGVDSLAFFDDNPVERAWVRAELPEVTVIDVPVDPLRYGDALDDSGAFDHLVITAEDRQRAAQYHREAARRELEQSATSVDEFLRALQMTAVIGKIDAATLPRVVQLLGKTNQFNVTTRRYSEPELAKLLASEGAIGLWMRVADRYGDHGLVAVALAVRAEPARYRLDSFLMSCRILGRQAEHALVRSVARRARENGASVLLGEFIPSKKNAPAARLFEDAGFAPLDGTAPPSDGADGRGQAPLVDGTAPPSDGADGRGQAPLVDGTAPPSDGADGRGQAPLVDGTAPPSDGADGRGQARPVDGRPHWWRLDLGAIPAPSPLFELVEES